MTMTRFHHGALSHVARWSLLGAVWLGGCSSGGSGGSGVGTGRLELLAVRAGKLVDVYGLDPAGSGQIQLHQMDVVIGADVPDERQDDDPKRDEEITYDFIGVAPETFQQRVLITRPLRSAAFEAALEHARNRTLLVAPGHYGQDTNSRPFSAVARNSAFELRFSTDLPVGQDFFDTRDTEGRVIALRNPEAVQLLEIRGDPGDTDDEGDFRVIPIQIICRRNSLILDPVLLGNEAKAHNAPVNGQGLPESGDSVRANIRIALALEGPLRVPGLKPPTQPTLVGKDNSRRQALITDLRSGNRNDDSPWLRRGFARDGIAPRLIGAMTMLLERVQVLPDGAMAVTLFKAGVRHELDRGDVMSLFVQGIVGVVASTEIVVEPTDDAGKPTVQHVTAQVRGAPAFAQHDPSRRPDYPTEPAKLEEWLLKNAPRVSLSAEFTLGKDDPRYFVEFAPAAFRSPGSPPVEPNVDVPVDAGVVLRFTKALDLASVRPYDNCVLSTLADRGILHEAAATPHLIAVRAFDADGSGHSVRLQPPFGFYLDDSMRGAGNRSYYVHVFGGAGGLSDLSGNEIDLRGGAAESAFTVDFKLDPTGPTNRVASVVRRFVDADEDELKGRKDFFGAVTLMAGRVRGRGTSRSSSVVDDRNQIAVPPTDDPAPFCTPASGSFATSGGIKFNFPIQNPMNPLGCRFQTCWLEIDLSLSRTQPQDFDLDVEQMHWAPHSSVPIYYDEFDRASLFLGHSERRPSLCSATMAHPESGLRFVFKDNYVRNLKPDSSVEDQPPPFAAYVDQVQKVLAASAFFEPQNVNRFMPLPKFVKPNFTWRDQRLMLQGGGEGETKVASPFVTDWDSTSSQPREVDGKVGSIALPLLADFFYYPDSPDLPRDNPFIATGFNGWQIAVPGTFNPPPYIRVYTAGGYMPPGYPKGKAALIDPALQTQATGGYTPQGARTIPGDNSVYWAQVDFLRRVSVLTSGFVSLRDPHRAAAIQYQDPRLGPYYTEAAPLRPTFDLLLDPPNGDVPQGTSLQTEFRLAKQVVKRANIELDPRYAGEIHIRQLVNRGENRFEYSHVDSVTKYTSQIADLQDPAFLAVSGMRPQDSHWMNFRLVFENQGALSPSLDSIAITYRMDNR